MGLEVSPNRPLTRFVVGGVVGLPRRRASPFRPYVPPVVDPAEACRVPPDVEVRSVAARCIRALRGVLMGEPSARLVDDLDADVVLWSPTRFATSRDGALSALAEGVEGGSSLTGVTMAVTGLDIVGPRVYVEWRLTGRFTDPCFVDDDLLVEPTGRLVETAGILVVKLTGTRVSALHCYYDDFALLEQLLAGA